MDKKKVALVLSGGGAKAAFQARAVQLIDKHFGDRFEYEVISGVSAGALNASLIASRKINEMSHIWDTIKQSDIMEKRSLAGIALSMAAYKIGLSRPVEGLYSNEPLKNLLSEYLDPKSLIDEGIPLKVGRVDIRTGEYLTGLSRENYIDEILASSTIPVVWPPVEIDGKKFVDGGVRNNTPLGDVIPYGPDIIIIITNNPYKRKPAVTRPKKAKDLFDIAKNSLDILMQEVFSEDISSFLRTNRLVKEFEDREVVINNAKKYKYFDHVIIEPTKSLGDTLDFSQKALGMRKIHADNIFHSVYKEQLEGLL